MEEKKKDYIHKEYPKTKDSKDFWGQIKRTVNGQPISDEQIQMIIDAIENGLEFSSEDVLLDVGCGNGALTKYFFNKIKKSVGVDFSEYLISVAKENFEKEPDFLFFEGDAIEFVLNYKEKEQITKMLCYGVFSYFEKEAAVKILRNLYDNYTNLQMIYIGNIPNKDKADKFYYKDIDYKNLLDDNQSSIGIWRSPEEMDLLAKQTGWKCEIRYMKKDFYSSHYRYDAILTKSLIK